jgi:hypothetical protein
MIESERAAIGKADCFVVVPPPYHDEQQYSVQECDATAAT